MSTRLNEDYTLQEMFVLDGITCSLGYNPQATQPYATWETDAAGNHSLRGNFPTQDMARQDLIQRALDLLPESTRTQLIQANLSEELRAAIAEQGREEAFLADIEFCLEEALPHLGVEPSVISDLMEDPEFRARALHVYHNQDHSQENEALTESLEQLITDKYPDLLPTEFTAILKISPEELEIQQDLLNLTMDELEEKYGAIDLCEGMLSFCQQINSPQHSIDMEINIFPKSTPDAENHIEAKIFMGSPFKPWTRTQIGESSFTGLESIEQIYTCKDTSGISWQVDLHADERLRRIGQQFTFQTESDDPAYEVHNGQTCTVERMLNAQEADMLCSNMMWKVRFEDGTLLDAFDHELSLPKQIRWDLEQNPAQQKPVNQTPLAKKISSAKAQQTIQPDSKSHDPKEHNR